MTLSRWKIFTGLQVVTSELTPSTARFLVSPCGFTIRAAPAPLNEMENAVAASRASAHLPNV